MIVVYDVPLLVEGNLASGFDVVVVVEADPETRVARLGERGMPEADARARMAGTGMDEQRRAVAHEVITNDGTWTNSKPGRRALGASASPVDRPRSERPRVTATGLERFGRSDRVSARCAARISARH